MLKSAKSRINRRKKQLNKEKTMKLHSMFLSVALLTTACAARAMEEQITPVNLKSQLQAHIIACDAEQFNATWQTYQTTAQAEEVAVTQSTLSQLTTQLRAHKDKERAVRLTGKWSRNIAGLSGTLAGILSAGAGMVWICIFVIGDYKKYDGHIQVITPLMNGLWVTFMDEVKHAAFWIGSALLLGRFAAQGITYARFAGTQQLTKEIAALDAILACLNPESIDAENN
jgi:hypothetical protein